MILRDDIISSSSNTVVREYLLCHDALLSKLSTLNADSLFVEYSEVYFS